MFTIVFDTLTRSLNMILQIQNDYFYDFNKIFCSQMIRMIYNSMFEILKSRQMFMHTFSDKHPP